MAGYHSRLRDLDELENAMNLPIDRFDIYNATNLVFESLVHSGDRKISIFENWLLWLLGQVYEPIIRTQSPERIVAGGVAICSEAAAVLNRVATINNAEARFVGLNGHVISEIKIDGAWILADADYGIVIPFSHDQLSGVDEKQMKQILTSLSKARGFNWDANAVDTYASQLLSIEDNIVQQVGEQQSPRLWIIELFAQTLSWIMTIAFGLMIFSLSRRDSKGRLAT